MSNVPAEHIVENQLLEADAYVDLFEIQMLSGPHFYFKNNERVQWQGKIYEGWVGRITGIEADATEKEQRPQMVIANATNTREGLFSAFLETGLLDKATVIRRRVLRRHLDDNVNISQVRSWYVAQVASVKKTMITLELRSYVDGAPFRLPARKFIPPDFPFVTLN